MVPASFVEHSQMVSASLQAVDENVVMLQRQVPTISRKQPSVKGSRVQSDDEVDDVHLFVQRQVLSGKQSDVSGVPKRRGLTLQKLWKFLNRESSTRYSFSPCDVERCGLFKIRALHSVLETAIVRQKLIS